MPALPFMLIPFFLILFYSRFVLSFIADLNARQRKSKTCVNGEAKSGWYWSDKGFEKGKLIHYTTCNVLSFKIDKEIERSATRWYRRQRGEQVMTRVLGIIRAHAQINVSFSFFWLILLLLSLSKLSILEHAQCSSPSIDWLWRTIKSIERNEFKNFVNLIWIIQFFSNVMHACCGWMYLAV